MSGEPKTLTLTFQEAVELLGREYRAALVFLPYSPDQLWDAWSTLSIDEEGYAVEDFAPTWEETMSAFLGVPVVARDEAAELSEAVREVARMDAEIKAEFDWNADSSSTVVSEYRRRRNAAWERALGLTRRLAGGEEQE